ncbi:MAG TPA: dTDP-4-dehydrorhamnose 3,5-epimerase family protein [Candidatus Acidoferrum sp.]|nr:dTDP-4-dehydrorhamnose 3,5-epimerase family protein [Candidatus Acidoferrum sp.]
MILTATRIAGVTIVESEPVADDRGAFARTYDGALFREAGLIADFPEHSIATNTLAGTLRGLHYQIGYPPEAKIVRCTYGSVYDVVVDLRRSSATFGAWEAFTLDWEAYRALYIPPGCAHGYQTLESHVVVAYMISAPYAPSAARGINWADPRLAIPWPLPVTSISPRDKTLPYLDATELPDP